MREGSEQGRPGTCREGLGRQGTAKCPFSRALAYAAPLPPGSSQPQPRGGGGKEGTDSEWPETSPRGSQGSTSLVRSPPSRADSDSRENSNREGGG